MWLQLIEVCPLPSRHSLDLLSLLADQELEMAGKQSISLRETHVEFSLRI